MNRKNISFILISHLFILNFTTLSTSALAIDKNNQGCLLKSWGFRLAEIESKNKRATYVVRMKGLKWRLSPYGWHAPALLSCESCEPAMNGLLHLSAEQLEAVSTDFSVGAARGKGRYPRSAKERIERDFEAFGYPVNIVADKNLTAIGSHDALRVGDFEGHAVLYDATMPSRGKWPEQKFGLLALSFTDGCLLLRVTLQASTLFPSTSGEFVNDIISRLSIEKYAADAPVHTYWNEYVGRLLDRINYQYYEWRRKFDSN